MARPPRRQSPWLGDPLTYSTGTTAGEQKIAAATTAPTLVTDGFPLAGVDASNGNKQFAAPNFLDVIFELSGSASAAAIEAVSIFFYFPAGTASGDGGAANLWRESGPLKACGPDSRGAEGYADPSVYENGNTYKIDCPRGASRAFLHCPDLTTNVNVHALVYGDN